MSKIIYRAARARRWTAGLSAALHDKIGLYSRRQTHADYTDNLARALTVLAQDAV